MNLDLDVTVPVGIVLCGGRSRRMGRDKALIGDPPWAHGVATALGEADCCPVVLVGGDPQLAVGPWTQIPDDRDSMGPAAALATAARAHDGRPLVMAACDLPGLTAEAVRTLVDAVGAGAPVAVYDLHGRAQWSLVAIDAGRAASIARTPPDSSPSLHGLLGDGAAHLVPHDTAAVTDIDDPEGLQRVEDQGSTRPDG